MIHQFCHECLLASKRTIVPRVHLFIASPLSLVSHRIIPLATWIRQSCFFKHSDTSERCLRSNASSIFMNAKMLITRARVTRFWLIIVIAQLIAETMRVNNAVELQEETEEEQSGKFNSLPLASFNFINSIIGSGVIGKGWYLWMSPRVSSMMHEFSSELNRIESRKKYVDAFLSVCKESLHEASFPRKDLPIKDFFLGWLLFRDTICIASSWFRTRHWPANSGGGIDWLFIDSYGAKWSHLWRNELPRADAREFRPCRFLHSDGVAIHLSVHWYD